MTGEERIKVLKIPKKDVSSGFTQTVQFPAEGSLFCEWVQTSALLPPEVNQSHGHMYPPLLSPSFYLLLPQF